MAKGQILVVKDDAVISLSIQKALEELGYEVPTVACSGAEAIKKAAKTRPDLVLMDIMLKGDMDGIEASRQILNHLDIPIIYLTSNINEDIFQQAGKSGPQAYIKNPFNPKDLRNLIELTLYNHRIKSQLMERDEPICALLNSIDDLIGLVEVRDNRLYCIDANSRFLDFFGMNHPSAQCGASKEQIVPNEMIEGWLDHLREVECRNNIVKFEIPMKNIWGKSFWFHITVYKIFQKMGDLPQFLIVCRDITRDKKMNESVKRKIEFEKNIVDISSRFANFSNMDDAVNASLRDMGIFSNAIRSYLFLISRNGKTLDNTHKWCKEGVSPEIDNLKDLPIDTFPWLMSKLRKGKVIQIDDVSKLPEDANAEKEVLESRGVISLMAFPVKSRDALAGFIVFGNVDKPSKWRKEDLELLKVLSEVVGTSVQSKRAEDEIKRLLKEREFFLQEIHHRVKNNLMIIVSLLHFHSKGVKNREFLGLISNLQNRIQSMAFVHDKLYKNGNFERINFNHYIRDLVDYIIGGFKVELNIIRCTVDVLDCFFNISTAIPCGLIVNELVSNALKYAFPEGTEGEIRILLQKKQAEDGKPESRRVKRADNEKWYKLIVSDNGRGLPTGYTPENSDSSGLKLVKLMVEQLDGKITIKRSKKGTKFTILFKEH